MTDTSESINYGWSRDPFSSVTCLKLVQNAAAQILTNTNRSFHISPILVSLHWLPVEFRIDFKILLITFKAQHGLAPTYISQLLTPHNPSRNLRSASLCLLSVPRSRLTTQGDHAFSVRALRLWNSLPDEVRLQITAQNLFCRKAFLSCDLLLWCYCVVLIPLHLTFIATIFYVVSLIGQLLTDRGNDV